MVHVHMGCAAFVAGGCRWPYLIPRIRVNFNYSLPATHSNAFWSLLSSPPFLYSSEGISYLQVSNWRSDKEREGKEAELEEVVGYGWIGKENLIPHMKSFADSTHSYYFLWVPLFPLSSPISFTVTITILFSITFWWCSLLRSVIYQPLSISAFIHFVRCRLRRRSLSDKCVEFFLALQ